VTEARDPARPSPTPGGVARILAVLAVCALGVLSAIALLRPAAGASPASPATPPPQVLTSASMHRLASMFQDDQQLVYSPARTVIRTLDALRALGVDRLRITVLWSAIAPAAGSTTAPARFDAADPAAYPHGAWSPYDRVLELARARGIAVNFDLTAPGPLWAMGRRAASARLATHFAPSAAAFGRFAEAAGRRYSGRYVPPGARRSIPRVGFWSIWNEPNQPGWLAPQRARAGGHEVVESARLYRRLVAAAYAALMRTGHRRDTILVGELAPEGGETGKAEAPVPPIPFLEALYCVDAGQRPLQGTAARALGCPATGSRLAPAGSGFAAANPGLFAASGFAHHPYSFFLAPDASMRDPNFVPLSELRRLEHALDAIFHAYGVHRRLPLYLTEYGYETNPPNPFRGVAPSRQAAYLDQASYLAWRDPRVRALSQFLLVDASPDRSHPRGSFGYWSTFQTGLVYRSGAPKPALYSYALPIFVPAPVFTGGGGVTVWGMLRGAHNGTTQTALVQWRAAAGGAWRTLAVVTTRDPTGALQARVVAPGAGVVRLAWTPPGTRRPHYSRAVAVRRIG
jgi:hypothetical protein